MLFSAQGTDPESLTDQELEAKVRGLEGALRGLPEGFTLYQYTRVLSGFDIPRQAAYADPVTENFVTDRLTFLNETAKFRRVDLHWCLAIEPPQGSPFSKKPKENAEDNSRQLAELLKAATILESHLGHSIGLQLLDKARAFQFFSYLFNLEEWAERDQLRGDAGIDRQIVKSPVSDHRQEEGSVRPDCGGEIAMIETNAATVPDQPVSTPPLKKGFPVALILIGVIVIIALANLTNLVGGKGKTPVRSNLSTQPTSISPQQVKSYQTMQATEARRDAEDRQQHGINQAGAAPQQATGYPASDIPGPEADTAAPMTAAQRQSIYGDSPNAPQKTSNASQSHAEARQRQLAREKQQQDAVNSDTVAIDFSRPSGGTTAPASALADRQQDVAQAIGEELRPQQPAGPVNAASRPTPTQTAAASKTDPMTP